MLVSYIIKSSKEVHELCTKFIAECQQRRRMHQVRIIDELSTEKRSLFGPTIGLVLAEEMLTRRKAPANYQIHFNIYNNPSGYEAEAIKLLRLAENSDQIAITHEHYFIFEAFQL